MKKIKTFIICLPSSNLRYQNAIEQSDKFKLDAQLIDAIDLRNIDSKNIMDIDEYDPPLGIKSKKLLTPAEIGCALSHKKVYTKMIDEDVDYALILEDDVCFLEEPNIILDNIDNIFQLSNFDVLILGYVKVLESQLNYYYRKNPIKKLYKYKNFYLGTPWKQYGCGTVGYIITKQGALKMMTSKKVKVAADDWLYYEKNYQMTVLHLRPSILIENSIRFNSTIRVEKENFLKVKLSSYFIRSIKGIIKKFLMNYLNF